MVYSIDTDDFSSTSGAEYPLLRAINRELLGYNPSPSPATTTIATTIAITTITTTTKTPSIETTTITAEPPSSTQVDSCDLVCREPGYLRDPVDCAIFYRCVDGPYEFAKYEQRCPANLFFDLTLNVCNWPHAVDCEGCKL